MRVTCPAAWSLGGAPVRRQWSDFYAATGSTNKKKLESKSFERKKTSNKKHVRFFPSIFNQVTLNNQPELTVPKMEPLGEPDALNRLSNQPQINQKGKSPEGNFLKSSFNKLILIFTDRMTVMFAHFYSLIYKISCLT